MTIEIIGKNDKIYLTLKKDYKNRFQSYCFYFEELDLVGIAIVVSDKINKNKQRLLIDMYNELIISKDLLNFEIQDEIGDTWLYRCFDEDFNKIHGLRKILPGNLDILIDEYIKSMQSLIKDTLEEVDEIEKMLS